MNTILYILGICVLLITWVFSTSLTVDSKPNSRTSFIFKSVFYWFGMITSFCLGYLISK